jgi:lysophospholipid acyltransferase (LPLAT)-like uncharacterized protein
VGGSTGADHAPRGVWLARLLGAALALYARLVTRTARLEGSVGRDQAVIAFWHEYNLVAVVVGLKLRRDLPHASFSTSGFRGVVVTTMLRRAGGTVRVLPLPAESDRAGSRRLAVRLAALADQGWSPIVTPDGPFGPYRVAKPGALIVARASGLPIVPWHIAVRPALRLARRWDRQVVPLPFCRIAVSEGKRVRVGPRERLAPRVGELRAALVGAGSGHDGERLPWSGD